MSSSVHLLLQVHVYLTETKKSVRPYFILVLMPEEGVSSQIIGRKMTSHLNGRVPMSQCDVIRSTHAHGELSLVSQDCFQNKYPRRTVCIRQTAFGGCEKYPIAFWGTGLKKPVSWLFHICNSCPICCANNDDGGWWGLGCCFARGRIDAKNYVNDLKERERESSRAESWC